MEEKIKQEIEKIRPLVAQHFGDISFVKYADGVVYVALHGACEGCPLSGVTLKAGVEELLRHTMPFIVRVEAIGNQNTP
ncbi:MAG: NifU domain-containing protein [Parcubacteria group bacterium Gr01-1014_66]|nr:MAG: NifU domain-containing protein [Parcubacteria group bacterium Gr01-1014_66]